MRYLIVLVAIFGVACQKAEKQCGKNTYKITYQKREVNQSLRDEAEAQMFLKCPSYSITGTEGDWSQYTFYFICTGC